MWAEYETGSWSLTDVFAKRLDSTGGTASYIAQLNDDADGYRAVSGAAAATDTGGSLIATWQDYGDYSASPRLIGRVFDDANAPVTSEFVIANATTYMGFAATVAAEAATGNFVIAWDEVSADWTTADVFFQRYNVLAAPLGDPQQVNTTGGINHTPAVAIDGDQRIGVTWTTVDSSYQTTIQARWFDDAGQPATDEVLVNAIVGSGSSYSGSTIAADTGGNFNIAWSAYDNASNNSHIYQRQYSLETIDTFTEITVQQNTPTVTIDLRQYFEDPATLTYTLETNDNTALTTGLIDGYLLTLDITTNLTGIANLTLRATDGSGAFTDVVLTLTVA